VALIKSQFKLIKYLHQKLKNHHQENNQDIPEVDQNHIIVIIIMILKLNQNTDIHQRKTFKSGIKILIISSFKFKEVNRQLNDHIVRKRNPSSISRSPPSQSTKQTKQGKNLIYFKTHHEIFNIKKNSFRKETSKKRRNS
jgi:hypothetical protein